jgi:hypothetical protein
MTRALSAGIRAAQTKLRGGKCEIFPEDREEKK